jgi:hypothetical protein
MKRQATTLNKEVNLLEIQDEFEKLGWEAPSLTAEDALKKLGPARGITGADGKPKNKTTQNFLKLCLKAFRRGQRDARKSKSGYTKSDRKLNRK